MLSPFSSCFKCTVAVLDAFSFFGCCAGCVQLLWLLCWMQSASDKVLRWMQSASDKVLCWMRSASDKVLGGLPLPHSTAVDQGV
jgi:hypothetical protein